MQYNQTYEQERKNIMEEEEGEIKEGEVEEEGLKDEDEVGTDKTDDE